MKSTVTPLLAALLLILALACQQSVGDVDELVDERIAAALAAVPTITPQPSAKPHATATTQSVSLEKVAANVESLMERLATVESRLLAQDEEFREIISGLAGPEADVIVSGPLGGSIVTSVIESTTPSGRCWQYRVASDGTGNTLLVEWVVLEKTEASCYNPSSNCGKEVEIGAPLPRTCVG